jgi:hypothetical protein
MNVLFNLWFLMQKSDLIKPPSPSFLSVKKLLVIKLTRFSDVGAFYYQEVKMSISYIML